VDENKAVILIVDDEEPIRNILCRLLLCDGHSCEVAADGREALSMVSTKHFDLVLLDINMPKLSGMEVLHRLNAEYPNTCVIMLTGVADTKIVTEALKLGACDYIIKPFDLDDLSMRVKRALELKKLALENRVAQPGTALSEAIKALLYNQISLEQFKDIGWPQTGDAKSCAQFAIDPLEYLNSATKLALRLFETICINERPDFSGISLHNNEMITLTEEIFKAYLLGSSRWANFTGDGIFIPDYTLIKPEELILAEYSEIGKHPAWYGDSSHPEMPKWAGILQETSALPLVNTLYAYSYSGTCQPYLSIADVMQLLKQGTVETTRDRVRRTPCFK